VAGHKVDRTKSPQFEKLVQHWKRTYPHIEDDLKKALDAIGQNLMACGADRIQAGPNVEVYKYRQNSKDIRRGASYGWRIVALIDKRTSTLYPILVWPKPAWGDAADAAYASAIEETRTILGYCTNGTCDGTMKQSEPPHLSVDGLSVKWTCDTCNVTHWRTAVQA
jgi:hypothetical protein